MVSYLLMMLSIAPMMLLLVQSVVNDRSNADKRCVRMSFIGAPPTTPLPIIDAVR